MSEVSKAVLTITVDDAGFTCHCSFDPKVDHSDKNTFHKAAVLAAFAVQQMIDAERGLQEDALAQLKDGEGVLQ